MWRSVQIYLVPLGMSMVRLGEGQDTEGEDGKEENPATMRTAK